MYYIILYYIILYYIIYITCCVLYSGYYNVLYVMYMMDYMLHMCVVYHMIYTML